MGIRVHRRRPQARIAMIPQPVLAFFYAAAIAVVDALLACFGPVGRLPNRNSTDVDHQTDDELLNLCDSVPDDDWTSSGCPPRITPDVVAKRVPRLPTGWPSEALAQDLVHNRTNIPVPPIRRVLNLNPYASVIVMDYIPGITLAEAWPNMGLWQKIRTAITLRSYVRQLRSIAHPRSQIPGPVLEGEEPGVCFASRIFGPIRNLRRAHPVVQQRNGPSRACPIVRAQGAIAGRWHFSLLACGLGLAKSDRRRGWSTLAH